MWQLIWTAHNGGKLGELTETAELFISYLPLSHVAAQVLDIFIPLMYAVTVYFAQPDALKVNCSHAFKTYFNSNNYRYTVSSLLKIVLKVSYWQSLKLVWNLVFFTLPDLVNHLWSSDLWCY